MQLDCGNNGDDNLWLEMHNGLKIFLKCQLFFFHALLWPHFWGTVMHSQWNVDFCQKNWSQLVSKTPFKFELPWLEPYLLSTHMQMKPSPTKKWMLLQKVFYSIVNREGKSCSTFSFFFGNPRHAIFTFLPLQQYLCPPKASQVHTFISIF